MQDPGSRERSVNGRGGRSGGVWSPEWVATGNGAGRVSRVRGPLTPAELGGGVCEERLEGGAAETGAEEMAEEMAEVRRCGV